MRTFDPWIGSKYRSEGLHGVRVLVLGESHYGEAGKERSNFTTDVVRELGQTDRHRFFTNIQKVLLGMGPGWVSDEERANFWEHVAFYNYVQQFVGDTARVRPSNDLWDQGAAPFLMTLEELKPQVLVVLGVALEARLPSLPESLTVCRLPHPSSFGFSVAEWRPAVQAALAAHSPSQPSLPS